jgi:hypothetical protein
VGELMMVKLLIRLLLPILIVFMVITGGAALVGNMIDTYAVSAMVSSPRSQSGLFERFVLFDVRRNLRVPYLPPIENIASLTPWYGNDKLIITAQKGTFRDKDYERNLYIHNLYTGESITVSEIQSEEALGANVYYPNFSPSGDKMVYFETYDQTLYLFDLNTQSRKALWTADGNISNPGYVSAAWSYDGAKVAFSPRTFTTSEQSLIVFDTENDEKWQYEFLFGDVGDFNPQWSEGGDYIILRRFNDSVNTEVYILRASDGTRLPFTEGLQAARFNLGMCEDKWLTYSVHENRTRRGYILNLQTGETLRVNTHPMLRELNVGWITPQSDCEHFIVSGYRSSTSFNSRYTPLYLVNSDLSSVQRIHQGAVIMRVDENTIIYETIDLQTKRNSLYQRTLFPLSAPILLREYSSIETGMQWSEDYSLALYEADDPRQLQTPYGGRLIVFDVEREQTHYLTRKDERVSFYRLYKWGKVSP